MRAAPGLHRRLVQPTIGGSEVENLATDQRVGRRQVGRQRGDQPCRRDAIHIEEDEIMSRRKAGRRVAGRGQRQPGRGHVVPQDRKGERRQGRRAGSHIDHDATVRQPRAACEASQQRLQMSLAPLDQGADRHGAEHSIPHS